MPRLLVAASGFPESNLTTSSQGLSLGSRVQSPGVARLYRKHFRDLQAERWTLDPRDKPWGDGWREAPQ
jgi:hypothetical protein